MSDPIGNLDDFIAVLKGERGERRRCDRVKCLKRTRIIFGENVQAMHCFVSNLSDLGARLRPAAAERVPDRFVMQLEHNRTVDCKVIYRDGDSLGVVFL